MLWIHSSAPMRNYVKVKLQRTAMVAKIHWYRRVETNGKI